MSDESSGSGIFSPAVIEKARRYLAEERVLADPEYADVFWVRGSSQRLYRLQSDADAERGTATWVSCSCAHGMNTDHGRARCSHAVALLLAVRDSLDLPVRPDRGTLKS